MSESISTDIVILEHPRCGWIRQSVNGVMIIDYAPWKPGAPHDRLTITVDHVPSNMVSGAPITYVEGDLCACISTPPRRSRWRRLLDRIVYRLKWPLRKFYGWKVGRFFDRLSL